MEAKDTGRTYKYINSRVIKSTGQRRPVLLCRLFSIIWQIK